MGFTTDTIRNMMICGHSSTGKTTLTEYILANGGVIPKPETVEAGKTVSDFTEEEIERGISIHSSLSHIEWKKHKINLLDTPGAADFAGEVIAALNTTEFALLVIAADVGIQIETVKIWRRLNKNNSPRIIFINKVDKEHANFERVLKDLKEKFKLNIVPVDIPMGQGNGFNGVIDLIKNKAVSMKDNKLMEQEIPENAKQLANKYRESLIETVAEADDKLMEKYFDQGTLTQEEINKGLAIGFKSNKLVPVLCGSALMNIGITSLLDFIVSSTPAPDGEYLGSDSKGQEIKMKIDTQKPLSGFIFKTSIDQFSGKLSFIKVVTGKLSPDTDLINVGPGKKEKVSKILTCQGKKLVDVDELIAGDIGILNKLDSVQTNDTLCPSGSLITYKSIDFPLPGYSVTISAKSKKDEDKLNQLLQRTTEEDMTFQINYNKETKESVISGMGELHLSIILDKIRKKQKLEIDTKVPKIAYRETIMAPASAEYVHKKQTGGHGQYAKVVIEIKPLPRGEDFQFVNAIFGGAISRGYIPGVEKGILEGMESGIIAGYPVVDLEAKVVDGKEHSVDSSELSFKLAARGALRDALAKAKTVLLEPVMNLTVYVEDNYLGDILSDISGRRGKVLGQEPIGVGIQEVRAQVPHAELLRYSIDLKSITSGTASFEMEFSHYSPISGRIADEVIKNAKAEKE